MPGTGSIFEINTAIDENFLSKGRSGRNFYLNLDYLAKSSIKKPVINDDEYFTIKNKLIELVEENGWLINLNEYHIPNSYLDITDDEQYADQELLNDLRSAEIFNCSPEFEYKGIPKDKSDIIVNNRKVYKRDRQTSLNALAHANFSCEINEEHPLFMRRNSDVMYTEPHHLVPMAYSDKFDSSLDVEENIVSLCSNCHNQLHYGKGFELLLENLYNKRKEYLLSVNIDLSLEDLISMYR